MILNIKIFNNYYQLDLSQENDLSINYDADNLINPANYCSDFTHTIKLERTQTTNRIFAHYGEVDMLIKMTTYDPMLAMSYDLIDNERIVMSGDAYMQHVDAKYFYIVLYGAKNQVINKLINSGWNENIKKENPKYKLIADPLKYNIIDERTRTVNVKNVYNGWLIDSENQILDLDALKNNFRNLKHNLGFDANLFAANDGLYLGHFAQFLPTLQGYNDDFKSDKWYIKSGDEYKLVNILNFEEENQKEYEQLVDYQIGEYRTYYQSIGFYINKLFQIYQKECKNITGFDMILDDSFFNESNEYYKNTMIMLPPLFSKNDSEIINSENFEYAHNSQLPDYTKYIPQADLVTGLANTGFAEIKPVTLNKNVNTFTVEHEMKLHFLQNTTAPTGVKYNWDNPIVVHADLIEDGTTAQINTLVEKQYIILPLPDTKNETGDFMYTIQNTIGEEKYSTFKKFYDAVYITRYTEYYGGESIDLGLTQISLNYQDSGDHPTARVRFTVSFLNEKTPFISNQRNSITNGNFEYNYLKNGRVELNVISYLQIKEERSRRSGQEFTMSNIFKNVNPFSIILRFCKMCNLVFVVDDQNNIIYILSRDTHFLNCVNGTLFDPENQEITDITNIIDLNKIEIYPNQSDVSKIYFAGENKTKYNEDYLKKYDQDYGSIKIYRDNERTAETLKIFNNNENDKIISPLISSEFYRNLSDIKNGKNVKSQTYPEVSNLEKNNYLNFFFRNKNGEWDNAAFDGYAKITDDFLVELNTKEYAYHGTLDHAIITKIRPRLSSATWDDTFSLNFAPPQEEYIQYPFLPGLKYLYETFWKNYIEEIYNFENKIIKCTAHITTRLFSKFKVNPLVQINNSLYFLAKIENFNSNNIANITLIQIRDLNKLTNGRLIYNDEFYTFDDKSLILFDNNDKIIL